LLLTEDFFSESDSDSMPELVSLAGQTSSTDDSINLGICGLCFEEQHATTADCPLHGPGPRTATQIGSSSIGEFYEHVGYLLPELKWEHSDIRKGDQEMRRMLDIALGPTMNEWLTLPPHVSFWTLQAGARDARRAFEEFTTKYDAEKAEKERQRATTNNLEAEAGVSGNRSKAESTATDQVPAVSFTSQPFRNAHPLITQVKPPVLNPNRRRIIKRDEYSSSSAFLSSSYSSDAISYEEVEVHAPVPYQVETV
jgi:hypothetical protein